MNIKKYKYISFDIFDTLVVRNVNNPIDVLDIVEKKYNEMYPSKIKNFKQNRLLSGQKAVDKSGKVETLIDDFYQELENYYDKKTCKRLMELEKQIEIDICVPNKKYYNLYQELLKDNKKIIITSDMYLDEDTIKSILDKCNIKKYEKLYLSSVYQKRKSRGTIFDYIIDD